jgi:hypothetical protein
MIKQAAYIPNKIKQPAQCCVHCGKSYTRRGSLDKHIILCELINRSKKSSLIIEEDDPLPSQRKMYQMILELGKQYNKLEEKVDELNKWVIKKKKKINVLEWLNANMVPDIYFDNLYDTVSIVDDDVRFLFDNTFNDTLNEIFTRTLYENQSQSPTSTPIPIFAFVQKSNRFYVYDIIDGEKTWIEMPKEKLIKFLVKIQMKLAKTFHYWKKQNQKEISENDSLSIICDKASIKLMSVDFKQESTLSKIRSSMYNKMKVDMKALIEYEFEF